MKLVRTDAFLAGTHQVDGLQPMVHFHMAGLKDGADFDGEGLAALVTLLGADAGGFAAHLADALVAATVRADRTIRPDPRLDKRISGFFIVKVGRGQVRHDFSPYLLDMGLLGGYVKYNIAQ